MQGEKARRLKLMKKKEKIIQNESPETEIEVENDINDPENNKRSERRGIPNEKEIQSSGFKAFKFQKFYCIGICIEIRGTCTRPNCYMRTLGHLLIYLIILCLILQPVQFVCVNNLLIYHPESSTGLSSSLEGH